MTEGEKKRIYYELRNNDVRVGKTQNFGTTYTFGHYRVTDHFDYIYISKSHKNRPGVFVIMRGEDWGDGFPENDVYAIATAARNKSKRKEYIDPYKDIPTDVEIRDLTKMFGKELLKTADDFLPVDMSKYQALRTIVKLRQQLTQQLKEYYIK